MSNAEKIQLVAIVHGLLALAFASLAFYLLGKVEKLQLQLSVERSKRGVK